MATFNSLGSTVTSIDGRVTALENAPGVAFTADLTVNSLTATSFVQTPLLQSAAADLQIRNATTTLRAEDGTLLASFAAGSIGLEQDITVRSDRTLNATTADFAQFFVGSTAATGAFTSSSSITATQQIESDLRVQAPLLRCDPAASVLTVTGGTQGVLVDDTLRVNGAIAPEASLPFLSLTGGSSGVQVLSPLLEQIAVVPNSSVGIVARNAAATGDATLILDSNAQNGLVELKALAGGGVQMNTLFQFMSFNSHCRKEKIPSSVLRELSPGRAAAGTPSSSGAPGPRRRRPAPAGRARRTTSWPSTSQPMQALCLECHLTKTFLDCCLESRFCRHVLETYARSPRPPALVCKLANCDPDDRASWRI